MEITFISFGKMILYMVGIKMAGQKEGVAKKARGPECSEGGTRAKEILQD